MSSPRVLASTLLFIACLHSQLSAQITLGQDFDSGSLDVAASSINGSIVNLEPRETWTDIFRDDNYRWVHFRANGVQGVQPEFRIDESFFLGSLSGHRYVYSYDQSTWEFFDNGTIVGDEYIFSNNGVFTNDEVYVAYAFPYPVSRTEQLVGGYASSPYVMPTASASSGFVIGQSPGGIDELGRAIPQHDLFALRITDPTAVGPKQKVVMAAGSHPSETGGNFGVEGFIEFLTGPTLAASQLRSVADFYVYPQTNPDGQYAGYYRSSVEFPDRDYNRFFDNPAGMTDLSQVTAAMVADTGGDVDYVFDFHSWFGPWSSENFLFTVSDLVGSPYLQQLATLEPTLGVTPSSGQSGMLRIWGMSAAGLNAEQGYTIELGFHPGRDIDRLLTYGENFARALLATLGAPTACDLDADGDCDVADVDLLTAQGNLVAGAPVGDIKFDLDGNGTLDGNDLSAWLALAPDGQFPTYLPADVDLDGTVNGIDFLAWNSFKFTTNAVWSNGDFNGDGNVDGADFVIWNQHKFQSVDQAAVPEGIPSVCLLCWLFLARCWRLGRW